MEERRQALLNALVRARAIVAQSSVLHWVIDVRGDDT